MNNDSLFASKNLAEHLLRGALGLGALYWAVTLSATAPFAALALGVGALVALRGCPVCWSIGLLQTARQTLRR